MVLNEFSLTESMNTTSEKRKFEKLINKTSQSIRLTYWKQIMYGLSQNEEILIKPETCCDVPNDACVDEYKCISEDYSSDIFKFRQNIAGDGNYFWIFEKNIQVSVEQNVLVIVQV